MDTPAVSEPKCITGNACDARGVEASARLLTTAIPDPTERMRPIDESIRHSRYFAMTPVDHCIDILSTKAVFPLDCTQFICRGMLHFIASSISELRRCASWCALSLSTSFIPSTHSVMFLAPSRRPQRPTSWAHLGPEFASDLLPILDC